MLSLLWLSCREASIHCTGLCTTDNSEKVLGHQLSAQGCAKEMGLRKQDLACMYYPTMSKNHVYKIPTVVISSYCMMCVFACVVSSQNTLCFERYYLLKLLRSCLLLIYSFQGGIQLFLETLDVCSLLCLLGLLRLLCLLCLLRQLLCSKGILDLRAATAGSSLRRTATYQFLLLLVFLCN